jgi:hypothetical protein
MSGKNIKKGVRIFLYLAAGFFAIVCCLYFLLRLPYTQTWLTNKIAQHFASKWHTPVRVGGVDVELFKKIVLEEVYVEDLHQDTLLYIAKLKLDIGALDNRQKNVFVENVMLDHAVINLKLYTGDEDFNYQFILNEFASSDTTQADSTAPWRVSASALELKDVRFSYRTRFDTLAHSSTINFYNLSIDSLNGKISDVVLSGDTLQGSIDQLSFVEKSGFKVKQFSSIIRLSSNELKASTLTIKTNRSEAFADITFNYHGYEDFYDFINKVKMKGVFDKSLIQMADVAYFSSELEGMDIPVELQGEISGRVVELKGKNMLLEIGSGTTYLGNILLSGLPDIDKTYMSFDANMLATSKKGMEQIPLPPFNEKKFITLPSVFSLLETIKFKGNFSGYYYDFVSYGRFNTTLGQIKTDISMKQDEEGFTGYKGKFITTNFNLGRFLESEKYLDRISMNVDINGKGFNPETARAWVEGKVSSVNAMGYEYKNINLNGQFAKNIFNGGVLIADDNLNLDFDGNMDFSQSPTLLRFHSSIHKANLSNIHLISDTSLVSFAGKVEADIVGTTLNDLVGNLQVQDISWKAKGDVFDFGDMHLSSKIDKGQKRIELTSSIADATLRGNFKPSDLKKSFTEFLHHYFPSTFILENKNKPDDKKKPTVDELAFNLTLKNATPVLKAFFPHLSFSAPASCSGNYHSQKKYLALKVSAPSVLMNGYHFSNFNFSSDVKEEKIMAEASCKRLQLADSLQIDNIQLNLTVARDTLGFDLLWKNGIKKNDEGRLHGIIQALDKSGKMKTVFFPSSLVIADSTWRLQAGNAIFADTSAIAIHNLLFCSRAQKVGWNTIEPPR